MNSSTERVILSADDMSRAVVRIAHEITEKNPETADLVIIGIVTRGVTLGRRISHEIKKITDTDVVVGKLDVTFYRDDINSKGPNLNAAQTDIPLKFSGKTIVLVDDVLFTGRSIRAAIDALIDHGRPARIQLAVLLDRGHRELPIRPDYVGKNIPTTRSERVRVMVTEIDGVDKVLLTETVDG
ncbi:MAG: bifunctional protein PyrR [bacterium]|nr:MAG: bifunctional protein PyrR [bacterium]